MGAAPCPPRYYSSCSVSALDLFHPAVSAWFSRDARRAHPRAGARLAAHRARRVDAAARPHGLGQDARGVPGRHRPPRAHAPGARAGPHAACSTSRRSRPWPSTSSATCGCRSRESPGARRADARRAHDGRPHGRHAPRASARGCPAPRRHPHHDARVALPDAHVGRARDARGGRDASSSTRSTRWSPTKRGAHLALSLERLEALRAAGRRRRCSASG